MKQRRIAVSVVRPALVFLAAWALTGCATSNDRQPRGDGGASFDAVTIVCGNGIVEPSEECDDGNLLAGDGCSPTCTLEGCDPSTCFHGCCSLGGACVGGVDDTACGTGGVPCRDCNATGGLCFEQDCLTSSACTPGDVLDCGFCGTRECGPNGSWGACESTGECLPDAVDVVGSCGFCGQLVKTCDQTCRWGALECVGEGVCQAGSIETGSECTGCGQNQRSCSLQCLWDAWECVGLGTCPGGGTCCDGECTDTETDPDYCGSCTHSCVGMEACCDGGCRDLQTDAAYCGSCAQSCLATQSCCAGGCDPYECITVATLPSLENSDSTWPADPSCPADTFTVGILTERHYGNFLRKYALCVKGAQGGAITRCTGAVGDCTPPACPGGTTDVLLFMDYDGGGAIPEQQRICVGELTSASVKQCSGAVGADTCTPAGCAAGEIAVPIIREHDIPANQTHQYRICLVPACPPSCP